MIDLDRLYQDGYEAGQYNDIFLRIVEETKRGVNLRNNLADTESALIEANRKIEEIKQRGGNPDAFIQLRDEVILLRQAIVDRLSPQS